MDEPYCANSCGVPAVGELLAGLTSLGDEVVELVCYKCLIGHYDCLI